jgi:tRNA dimethylallyltransferase
MKQNQIEIFAILGPTASGKTEAAIRLAQEFNCEIISCDSRQVYRHMNIGTAKPTMTEQKAARHWMIDVFDPSQPVSAWDYASMASQIIKERHEAGVRIILCGGTGLYYKSLIEGLSLRVPSNPEFRIKCEERAAADGPEVLHSELASVDAESAGRLHPNDLTRVIRALQVFHDTGVPFSRHLLQKPVPTGIHCRAAILSLPRSTLYERINSRVTDMLSNGLFIEFEKLRGMGYGRNSPGMECVGYKELFAVEDGTCSLDDAAETIRLNTRHFAKRQLTWFSKTTGETVDMESSQSFDKLRMLVQVSKKA